MDPKYPHPQSQTPIDGASFNATFQCSNGHRFMSNTGVCPICGDTQVARMQGRSNFTKAFSAPLPLHQQVRKPR